MNAEYDRRQRPGQWAKRGRWSPDGLPDWYVQVLAGLAGSLTAWREHDPGQHLDPRTDPRESRHRAPMERRHAQD